MYDFNNLLTISQNVFATWRGTLANQISHRIMSNVVNKVTITSVDKKGGSHVFSY